MAGAKQLVTLGFYPGSGRGLYVQQGCARGTILRCTMVLIEGGLQARRKRRSGLQVPKVLTEASANIMVKAETVQVIAICRPPYGWGTASPFIGQGGSSLQVCRTVLATCEGMAYSATK
jgi:hypothetical protein